MKTNIFDLVAALKRLRSNTANGTRRRENIEAYDRMYARLDEVQRLAFATLFGVLHTSGADILKDLP